MYYSLMYPGFAASLRYWKSITKAFERQQSFNILYFQLKPIIIYPFFSYISKRFLRFRAGFKQAFRCCPCVPEGSYDGLELKSTRYLQTQTSLYRASRMETTVSCVMQPCEDSQKGTFGSIRGAAGRSAVHSPSREFASNGSSSRSISKTVSETSSFYSSNNLQEWEKSEAQVKETECHYFCRDVII